MGTQITFQTLYGCEAPGPICSVLRINDFTVLLDCGWDDAYDPALLAPVIEARTPSSFRKPAKVHA